MNAALIGLGMVSKTYGAAFRNSDKVGLVLFTDEVEFFRADQETGLYMAPADTPIVDGRLLGPRVLARKDGDASLPPVALKMPTLAAAGRGAAERLAREGAILAALNHPGIARLLEAGTTGAGLSFLALEFVPGLT